MKSFFALAVLVTSSFAVADPKLTLQVNLSPAGSFQAVSNKVKGNLLRSGDTFTADKISVTIESFKSGIDLRDEHLWKHMQSAKHPKATLTDVKGQGGKATGILEVNNIKKPVAMAYKVVGQEVHTKFTLKASDFALPKAEYLGVGVDNLVGVEAAFPFITK
ncbi:MAG TPA: YceI family protein [Bacteriovoracaceae bacterium]|nr:YceI family protein [Bacteriovoracaceae bacterium]